MSNQSRMSNQFENGSGSNPAAERKAQIENACTTAEEFCKNFFDRYDNKRHTIEKLYLDSATLSWNGNKVEGSSTIQKFLLDKIPSKSVHRLLSMDAQPIASAFTGGQTTILVQVRYGRHSNVIQSDFSGRGVHLLTSPHLPVLYYISGSRICTIPKN